MDKSKSIVLILHGILGDTKSIRESLMEIEAFPSVANFVLTYDYENLSTPLSKTAKALGKTLSEAGFGSDPELQLIIVAHSMGGLVSRILLKAEGASSYVTKLIFAGTPNGGSELGDLKKSVFGLLTHALNVTGPIKYAITGLSFLLKKLEYDIGETLNEMTPGSDSQKKIWDLGKSENIAHYVIGGNTSLLSKDYKGEDFFLKKIAAGFKLNLVYPGLSGLVFNDNGNDMAVTLSSMKKFPEFEEALMHIVVNDHVSYFSEKASQWKLIELLANK